MSGLVKEIMLTRGLVTLVDSPLFPFLNQFKWYAGKAHKDEWYARRGLRVNGRVTFVVMHRLIAGAGPGQVVDHINGNCLDNRLSNLRLCSQAQNTYNRRLSKNSKTGLKGATFNNGAYRATIRIERKRIHLGNFETAEEAAHAYDDAAIKYFGEFANLNFPWKRSAA